jgi:hypothetical protein
LGVKLPKPQIAGIKMDDRDFYWLVCLMLALSMLVVHRILRSHLGLKITKGEVFISVDGIKKKWQEGKVLIFDDKFLHYAENNTNQTRIVLFLDILKPLPWAIQLYNRGILHLIELSPFIKRMVENS